MGNRNATAREGKVCENPSEKNKKNKTRLSPDNQGESALSSGEQSDRNKWQETLGREDDDRAHQ